MWIAISRIADSTLQTAEPSLPGLLICCDVTQQVLVLPLCKSQVSRNHSTYTAVEFGGQQPFLSLLSTHAVLAQGAKIAESTPVAEAPRG